MRRGMKLKKINFKKHKNQKNEDQTQNKYKIDDTTKFLKVFHKNQGPGERTKSKRKKLIVIEPLSARSFF